MKDFNKLKQLFSVLAEVGQVFQEDHFFDGMTKGKAERIKSLIDKTYSGLKPRDYKRIYYLSLWSSNILPKDPATGEHYTIRVGSNVRPGTCEHDRKIITSVPKFYLQIRDITKAYVHPSKRPSSTADLLAALKGKAFANVRWQEGIANLSTLAESLGVA